MINQQVVSAVERSGGAEESIFQIKANRKAFDILSSALYSDKIKAVVRELCVNGYDSHVANGNPDTPVEIHLPTPIDPQFYVRDFGTGLSKEDIMGRYEETIDAEGNPVRTFIPGLYQTFFDSNKAESNDFVGMLGLGSKSPLSYSSQFMVESRHGGMKRTFCVFKNEDGLPTVRLMNEDVLGDEPTGLTVTLAVRPADVDKFSQAAKKALMYFTPLPKVVGQSSWQPYSLKHTVTGNGWKLRESEYYAFMTGPFVVQGFIAYPIDHNLLAEHQKLTPEAAALCSIDLDLYVNIGDVDIAPSREALSYDKRTIDNLACSLEAAAEELRKSFVDAFDACPTYWAAQQLLDKYHCGQTDKFKNIFRQMHKAAPFTWKGKAVSNRNTVEVGDTTLYVVTASLSATKKKVRWSDSNAYNGNYEANVDGATAVLVDTTSKGKSDVILQYLRSMPKANGHDQHVILIRPQVACQFSQPDVDKIINRLGHPQYTMVDSLPYQPTKKVRASGPKRDKSVMLVWSGFRKDESRWGRSHSVHRVFSRLTWTHEAVDLAEGGLYIPIERFTAMKEYKGSSFDMLDVFIAHATKLGLLDDDAVIIGMNEKECARAQKEGEWVNVIDEVVSNFEMDNENNELVNKVIATRACNELNANVPSFVPNIIERWADLEDHLTTGPFKTFCTSIIDLIAAAGDVDYAAVDAIIDMARIKVDLKNPVADYIRELHGMFKKYPMFSILNWERMNNRNFPQLIEYINSVDLARDPV